MKAVIAGGTGFVGKQLTDELINHGYDVYILTRNRKKQKEKNCLHYVTWLKEDSKPEKALNGADVFINLSGESLNSGRWTKKRKKQIINSRLTSTREIIRIMRALDQKPAVFVNASAIGIYPVSESAVFTESAAAAESGFLSRVAALWEQEALEAHQFGIPTVLARFGVVLGTEDGALPHMALPYKLYAGGKIGTGRQWMSWIHVQDAARALRFVLENKAMAGPVNITAPYPVSMNDLGKTLAKVLRRPHWLFVPQPIVKLALGEMSTLILDGQKVLPDTLLKNGFQFKFPLIEQALAHLYDHSSLK